MDPIQLHEVAVLVDESPQMLNEAAFTEPIRSSLKEMNGAFTAAAAERGIVPQEAEHWLSATEELFDPGRELGPGEAADLAVRLSALAFILSEGKSAPDVADRLLATATAPPEPPEAGAEIGQS